MLRAVIFLQLLRDRLIVQRFRVPFTGHGIHFDLGADRIGHAHAEDTVQAVLRFHEADLRVDDLPDRGVVLLELLHFVLQQGLLQEELIHRVDQILGTAPSGTLPDVRDAILESVLFVDPLKIPLGQIQHRLAGKLQDAAIVYDVLAGTHHVCLFVPVHAREGMISGKDRALDAFIMHQVRSRDAGFKPCILDHDLDQHAILLCELVDLFKRHLPVRGRIPPVVREFVRREAVELVRGNLLRRVVRALVEMSDRCVDALILIIPVTVRIAAGSGAF